MNERIKELATEVGISVEYLTNTKQWTLIEALAELIVRECIEVVKWTPSQFPNGECVKNIKEHFGVKE